MAKSVKIGNRSFGSYKEADAHYKSILDRADFNRPIFAPKDHKDLCALIQRYNPVLETHGVPTKIPAPISHFEKKWNRGVGFSTPGLWLVCTDGFATDFSYKKAIRAQVDSPDFNFYKACREAVAEDLLQAKKAAFKRYANSDGQVKCEVTGRWLDFKQVHLDHAAPFSFNALVLMFREIRGWTDQFPEHLLTDPGPGDFVVRFVDHPVRDSFRALHKHHASLRLISKKENLARASLARRPAIQRAVTIR